MKGKQTNKHQANTARYSRRFGLDEQTSVQSLPDSQPDQTPLPNPNGPQRDQAALYQQPTAPRTVARHAPEEGHGGAAAAAGAAAARQAAAPGGGSGRPDRPSGLVP